MDKIPNGFYSTKLCPYAHRSRLALVEKQIPFTLIEIDLQHKPANFREISPAGKVPVLKHDDRRIWESAIINEYLEEVFPTPALLPKDPIQRAQARIWINFADTRLFALTHKLLFTPELTQQVRIIKEIIQCLQTIEQEGLQKLSVEGPYWLGTDLSLVDLTYYPWFEQVVVLEYFCGFTFPTELDRLKRWWKAVADCESVRSQSQFSEFYLEHYSRLQQQLFKS